MVWGSLKVKVFFVALGLIVVPVLLFVLWCLCSEEKTVAQRAGAMVCRIVCFGIVAAVVLGCIYSVFSDSFKRETSNEKLDAIRDEIGLGGILDYVLGYWDESEVIEYIFDR